MESKAIWPTPNQPLGVYAHGSESRDEAMPVWRDGSYQESMKDTFARGDTVRRWPYADCHLDLGSPWTGPRTSLD